MEDIMTESFLEQAFESWTTPEVEQRQRRGHGRSKA
jgi:hypothetical protein